MDAEELFIVPPSLFDKDKPFNLIDTPILWKEWKQTKILSKSSTI